MEGEKNRVLLIEDNPGDARLIRELLSAEERASFFLEHADRLSTGLARLAQGNIDVILLDLSLPDSHGLEGLNKICAQVPKVPVVVLSGLSDEAVAINAVHGGAQDYLVKGSVGSALLVRSLRYAIERQHLRVALRESESRYRLLADNAADIIWTANMKWRITYVSPSIKRLLGYTVEEMMRLAITDILTPDSLKQASKFIRNQMDIMTPESQSPPLSLTLEYVRKDRSTLWAEVMLSFLWDKDGKLSQVLGVTREITERKKAEEALRQSEQRYRLLAENVKDIIWTRDMNLKLTYTSPSVLEMSGYSVEEVMSMGLEESLTPASLERLRPTLARVLAAGEKGQGDLPEVLVLEAELIHKGGSIMPVEMKVNLLRDSDGQPTGFLGVTRDITERKKAEEALRHSEQLYRLLAENIKDVIWTVDMNLRLTYTSPSITQLTGYRHEEYITKTLEEILTPASVEFVTNLFSEELALDDGGHSDLFRARTFEAELICKDGSAVPVEMKATALRDADARPIGVLGVSRDISERKRAEEALRESQEELQAIFDNARDGIALFDLEGRLLKANKRVLEVGGYTMDEIAGKTFDLLKMFTPESIERMFTAKDMISSGKEVPVFECEACTKSGRKLNLEIHVSPFFLKGKRLGSVSIMRDITERKKAEDALKESEARFRTVFDGTGLGIALVDFNGKALSINPAFEQMIGYNMEEFKKLEGNLKYLHPDDAMVDAKLYIEMLKGKREHYTVDKRYIRKDGGVIWGRQNLSVVRGAEGKPKYFVAMVEDITARKKMEEALRQSEERYRELVENANDIIYTHDLAGNFTSINKAAELVTGYTRDEVIGMNIARILTPESMERARQMIARKVSDGVQTRYELEIVTKDGHKILLEVNTRIIYEDGKPVGVQGIARDITERKKAENALRESEEKLRRYLGSSPDAIYINDEKGTFLYGNLIAERMMGYSKEELIGHSFLELNILPPEYLARAVQTLDLNLAGKPTGPDEFELVRKDGSRIFVEISTYPTTHDDKVEVIGIARDITERKRMEEVLRESEEKYRLYFENASDVIYSLDPKGTIMSMSPVVEKMLGYKPEELIGKNIFESNLQTPETMEKALFNISRVLAGEHGLPTEGEFIAKDGTRIFGEISGAPIFSPDGKVIAIVCVGRDITERKRIEEEVRLLSDAVRMSTESMFIASVEGKVADANEAALKMFGAIHKSDLIGKGVLELIVPEDHEKAFENIKKVLEGAKLNPEEYCIVRKDGSRNLSELSASVLMGGDGKPTGFVAVGHDITERKRMEEALRQSEHNYRVLFEGTIDGMFVTDTETVTIVLANQTAAKMCGFDSVENTVGINPLDLVHPDDRERVLGFFMEDAFGKGEQEVHEFRVIAKDGREIWVSGMGTRIEYGGKLAVLSSIRDVTEHKRAEEQKKKMEEQLRLASRLAAVGELAAGVGHELNNPIAAIQGFAQFLAARKDLDEPTRKDLDTIYRESQRAAKITRNLLSFARRHEPEKHLISINEAIEKTVELRAHTMKLNNVELVMELAPDLPKTLADFHQMQQVFVNIINNAEQAMVEAHGKGRLVVRTQKVRDMIQISFADNGPGISEENMQRIFDPFFTTKEVGKGTGLGLSICYGLVEAHGGRISARSKLGQGATFVVEIPIVFEDRLVAEAALISPGSRGAKWKKPKG